MAGYRDGGRQLVLWNLRQRSLLVRPTILIFRTIACEADNFLLLLLLLLLLLCYGLVY
jgi:hypothetical protein